MEKVNIKKEEVARFLQKIAESMLNEEKDKKSIRMDLVGNLNIVQKSENKRIIAGYASVAVIDKEDQFIPIETLKEGIKSLLEDPHYSNLMLVHKNIQIGKIIESYGKYKTHVDEKGLFIVAEIRSDIKTADAIWEAMINGEINAFSIGCEVLLDHKECDDKKCITILDKINIFEVSVCSEPVNQDSGFIIVSKSVCKECNLDNDIMTKKKIEKVTKAEEPKEEPKEIVQESEEEEEVEEVEEKTEEVEEKTEESQEPVEEETKSIEDRLEDLDRKFSVLEGLINEMMKAEENIPEEPGEEIPEEPEEEIPEEEMSEDKSEEEEEEKSEDESYSFPKKAFDEVIEKLSAIADKLSANEKDEDLKLAIKSRDDQIEALKKQLESKPELPKIEEKGEPKTKVVEEEEFELEGDIKVEKGMVYFND